MPESRRTQPLNFWIISCVKYSFYYVLCVSVFVRRLHLSVFLCIHFAWRVGGAVTGWLLPVAMVSAKKVKSYDNNYLMTRTRFPKFWWSTSSEECRFPCHTFQFVASVHWNWTYLHQNMQNGSCGCLELPQSQTFIQSIDWIWIIDQPKSM